MMHIYIVDAFTKQAFKGNPAAVCLLDNPISDELMQKIASEMNLSETAFIKADNQKFELRWFTPKAEVDLCGHATLASAHILWEEKITDLDEITFSTKSGDLTARRNLDWIEMNFPQELEQKVQSLEIIKKAINANVIYIGKNRLDYLVEVNSEEDVKTLKPDFQLLAQLDSRGVIVTAKSSSSEYDFVSRCFYPKLGVNEDPVTGSAHCGLGPYWSKKEGKHELIGKQLSERSGIVRMKLLDNRIVLAGSAVTVIKGQIKY
jgi:PhzF family phenazine biosynthesis protein